MPGVVIVRIVDPGLVGSMRRRDFDGRGVEILLQRRHPGMKSNPSAYCPPCGTIEQGEAAARDNTAWPVEARLEALWTAALRETIEEAGGGAGPSTFSNVALKHYPPGRPCSFDRVCLPRPLLEGAGSTVFLGDPGRNAQGRFRGGWFLYVLGCGFEDKEWSRSWRPRALPRWRGELDEAYNHAGFDKG